MCAPYWYVFFGRTRPELAGWRPYRIMSGRFKDVALWGEYYGSSRRMQYAFPKAPS